MIEISYTWFFIIVIILLLLFAFLGAAEKGDKVMYDDTVNTIRKDISGLFSKLSSEITKTVSYYHSQNAEIKELSQVIDRMENAVERIEKAAERMDRASKNILKSSNKIANTSSILTIMRTLEK